jgi:hypothetical protein
MSVSPRAVIEAWEWGRDRHPVDGALLLLRLALPEQDWADLAALSIGRRNAHLLEVREQLFGPTLSCYVRCPRCSAPLEFALRSPDLRGPKLPPPRSEYELTMEQLTLRFRLPDSRDLAALVGLDDVSAARERLLRRCLLGATRNGEAIALEALPASAITALADEVHSLDPLAILNLALTCDDCGHEWRAVLDPVAFLRAELTTLVRRLLREVHLLARAYGWREDDILAMSTARRQLYLEMIGA